MYLSDSLDEVVALSQTQLERPKNVMTRVTEATPLRICILCAYQGNDVIVAHFLKKIRKTKYILKELALVHVMKNEQKLFFTK